MAYVCANSYLIQRRRRIIPHKQEQSEVGGKESHELSMAGGHTVLHKERVGVDIYR